MWYRSSLQNNHLRTKFNQNPPIGSKVAPLQKFKRPSFWIDQRHLQYHHLHTKCHPNPPIGSGVIKGVLSLHPPQKFKRQPFWNGWTYTIKNVKSRSSSMASPA
jgi:hypothetical protein